MSFIDIAKKRYSVREYKDVPVERESIYQVLEAARVAPSAVNYQPWRLLVITDEGVKSKVAETYPREWFKKAPVIIAVCGDHSSSWKRKDGKDHCDIDAAIAMDHMTLAAADIGLGTCWVCAFDAERCHEALGLPGNMEVIALMPMGYPATDNRVRELNRKSIDDLVSWERYEV